MNPTAKHTLRALLGVCACALLLPLPAAAAPTRAAADSACWKILLNDWYRDATVDGNYDLPCYREAISHLPDDIEHYSNAAEDIQRALAAEIVLRNNPDATTTTSTEPGVGTTTTATTTTTPIPGGDDGPIPEAIKDSAPGGATSFPLPLIILGGLAIFLLAAGAIGLVVRRMQDGGDASGPPATP